MFESIAYTGYDRLLKLPVYTLIDTDFGTVTIKTKLKNSVATKVIVATEYINRCPKDVSDLSKIKYVAKNLAVFTVWHSKTENYTIKQVCNWQDTFLRNYIPNWDNYDLVAEERNEYIDTILIIK